MLKYVHLKVFTHNLDKFKEDFFGDLIAFDDSNKLLTIGSNLPKFLVIIQFFV